MAVEWVGVCWNSHEYVPRKFSIPETEHPEMAGLPDGANRPGDMAASTRGLMNVQFAAAGAAFFGAAMSAVHSGRMRRS